MPELRRRGVPTLASQLSIPGQKAARACENWKRRQDIEARGDAAARRQEHERHARAAQDRKQADGQPPPWPRPAGAPHHDGRYARGYRQNNRREQDYAKYWGE